jgi:hypothetical protein
MITGGVSIMTGLKIYDVYPNDTTLAIGILLIGYAFISEGMALRFIFWKDVGNE